MAKNMISNTTSQDNFATEKVNVISNCLLGDYVEEQYFISDEIKKELVNVKKVKKSVYKNSVFCSSFIAGYGDVVFEVTFQKNSVRNMAMAELFVLENEYKINGYIQNTIRTKVSEYTDSIDDFIEKAYKYFNISLTDSDGGKVYNLKEDISVNAYINAKKSFNLNMAKLTSKNYNKLYKNYVTARLKKLKEMENNPFAQSVLNKFNGEYSKIEKYFLKGNNYKALSELLDKSIEDCSGINPNFKKQEKEVMEQLTPIVDDFSRQADDIYTHYESRAEHAMTDHERELINNIQENENKQANNNANTIPQNNERVASTSSRQGVNRETVAAGREQYNSVTNTSPGRTSSTNSQNVSSSSDDWVSPNDARYKGGRDYVVGGISNADNGKVKNNVETMVYTQEKGSKGTQSNFDDKDPVSKKVDVVDYLTQYYVADGELEGGSNETFRHGVSNDYMSNDLY